MSSLPSSSLLPRALCLSLVVHLLVLVALQAALGLPGGAPPSGTRAWLVATLRGAGSAQTAPGDAAEALPVVQEAIAARSPRHAPHRHQSPGQSRPGPSRVPVGAASPVAEALPGGEASSPVDQSAGDLSRAASAPGAAGAGMAISGEDVAGRGGEEHATAQASLLRLFRLALLTQARSLKRYPPVSRAQAEEGVSRVRVAWYAEERRFAITVEHSSGFARLDEAAEALLEAATRRALLPPALAAADFSLTVPIMFRLDEP